VKIGKYYRFKGQQAPLVIIVDADLQNIDKQHEKNRLFCGMTRATLRLEIVTK